MKVAGYNDMAPIIPEGQIGEFRITHRTKTWPEVTMETMKSPADWTMRFARTGTYCILWTHDKTIMSDTDFERVTNRDILRDAQGHVLVGGLGIGMLPYHLCKKKSIKSVIVLELRQEVIELVAPHIKHRKLNVVQGDVMHPPLLPRQQFDYVYLDIWPQVGVEWDELKPLLDSYKGFLKKGGTVDAWLSEYIRIFDTLGIAKLPKMYRPLSGWLNRETRTELRKEDMFLEGSMLVTPRTMMQH